MSTEAVCLAAHRMVGLSWGNPKTRREYSLLLAPWDPESVAIAMASAQSSCALTVMAALLIAEVDGKLQRWRGLPGCDPLRSPRHGQYDSPPYLEQLAIERGLRMSARTDEPPPMLAGTYWRIGESGADVHVGIVVESTGADGYFTTVEGGKLDDLNPRKGAEKCTAIEISKVRLTGGPRRWTIGNRVLAYTADAGAMPCVQEGPRKGMPWDALGITPC